MTGAPPDLASTPLVLPPDARLLPVAELAPRLRAKLGPAAGEGVVLTRPGFRVTTRLLPGPLATLLAEFRTASLLTDAVLRFSRAEGQDPQAVLELSFDALAALVAGRLLVAAGSPEAAAVAPSLAAGQGFAGLEVERLLRALDDTEVYRARLPDGRPAALKVARDGRAGAALAREAAMLARLGGGDTPRLLGHGTTDGRAWLAMEWRDGVPVAAAAQQARAARDGVRLHRLVADLLDAHARLHARGVLHGDIHPGNLLVAEDGRIAILDLGQARLAGEAGATDPGRTGIAHFHDPQMAAALLAGALPPAASAASEQYALAALGCLLLTGQHAIRPDAEHVGLLARIRDRAMLPFAAQGAPAWPRVEAVLRRALAKAPRDRFADTAAFARAFRTAGAPRRAAVRRDPAVEALFATLRRGARPAGAAPAALAWLALRAALARSDAELLAVADLWAARAGDDATGCAVAAEVARARSDTAAETEALAAFLAAVEGAKGRLALLQAARLLDGAAARGVDGGALAAWAERRLVPMLAVPDPDGAALHAALALAEAGVLPLPADLRARLDALAGGSAWLWALAQDALAAPDCAARARAAPRPRDPLRRGLACLRLHQVTGEARFVTAARRAADVMSPGLDAAVLRIELEAPWRVRPPPWLAAG